MQLVALTFYGSPKIYYATNKTVQIKQGDFVVAETNRGLELGKVFKTQTERVEDAELSVIIRIATEKDMADFKQNEMLAKKILPKIKAIVAQNRLNMKISSVQYVLDRSKIIISYTADERVDFRDLIKVLANEFKVRIEMRQIGSRDEVQQIGALGSCGRICCCKSFLGDFDKLSIKMAKNQGLALNPTKINGACGRLICCLKYEDEHYSQMIKKMPRVGGKVMTPDGEGIVQYNDLLKENVTVLLSKEDETERKVYPLNDIKFSTIIKKSDSDDEE